MQSHSSTTERQSNNFVENREKIRRFYEHNPLQHAIREFYQVQHDFHKNMANMVKAFVNVKRETMLDNRYLLTELLAPYQILAKNLFHHPTGNVEKDILHILEVINIQNEEFRMALLALLNSIANLGAFNNLLKECQQDKQLIEIIKQEFNCRSILTIQSYIDSPFQNLIRYETLLTMIQKHLIEAGFEPEENMIENLNNSIQYLVPEVQNINDSREVILLLNKLERMLGNLLAEVILKHLENQDKNEKLTLKEQIEAIMVSLKTGKTNIIQGDQDILSLFEALHDLLKNLEKNLTPEVGAASRFNLAAAKDYALSAGSYLLSIPASFFGEQDNKKSLYLDPISELKACIKELNEVIEQTEALKNVQEKLLRRRQ